MGYELTFDEQVFALGAPGAADPSNFYPAAELGTDADPFAILRAGVDPARVAEHFGFDNPATFGRTR
jgi:hypothetical protein